MYELWVNFMLPDWLQYGQAPLCGLICCLAEINVFKFFPPEHLFFRVLVLESFSFWMFFKCT